ncbi:hypothetical protein [Marinomonas mediterranea]|uniref:hypothetical protein n=1 Tax=Marinomonas mediterranea TaxID=119864 RepID=UPI0023494460|nr:hypothetical protein [Marinomonas mediterranea]WCN09950.1 hypothetical protein GV055_13990 [Marinomonas mediterranea]
MKFLPLIIFAIFIMGCSASAPFSENDIEAKAELDTYLSGTTAVVDVLKLIERKGFDCSTDIKPWVIDHIPDTINKEPMPHLCLINRTTVPLVCSDHWSIFIGHSEGEVLSTTISHSGPSCL